jgi:membrane associated rhomboid family serine protease
VIVRGRQFVLLVVVLAITGLELTALFHGVDGVALSASIGSLGAIGGWLAKTWRSGGGQNNP